MRNLFQKHLISLGGALALIEGKAASAKDLVQSLSPPVFADDASPEHGLGVTHAPILWCSNETRTHQAMQTTASMASSAPGAAQSDGDVGGLLVPEELRDKVKFWQQIYRAIDQHHGLVHDSEHVNVIYTIARAPSGAPLAQLQQTHRLIAPIKRALIALGHDKKENLTPIEQMVHDAWPTTTPRQEFLRAATRVRFQRGQSDIFVEGVARQQLYKEQIHAIFAQYQLPEALESLPLVESSFTLAAVSKARAAGAFQFTRAAARPYLRVDNALDERLDPIVAAQAAAQLLAHNYAKTQDWPLAITAYNHGLAGILHAQAQLHADGLGMLISAWHGEHFGFASKNFYAELLAAHIEAQRAQQSIVVVAPSPSVASIKMPHYASARAVSEAVGISMAALQAHNPALAKAVWYGRLRIPKGTMLHLPLSPALSDESAYLKRLAAIPAAERFKHQGGIRLASAARHFR